MAALEAVPVYFLGMSLYLLIKSLLEGLGALGMLEYLVGMDDVGGLLPGAGYEAVLLFIVSVSFLIWLCMPLGEADVDGGMLTSGCCWSVEFFLLWKRAELLALTGIIV
jgi:hypothetical protein